MKIYSTLMMSIAVGLFVAGALLYMGETGWLRSFNWVSVKDKKKYARFLGKVVADLGLVALASALAAKLSIGLAVVVLIAGFIAVMIYASKKSSEHYK